MKNLILYLNPIYPSRDHNSNLLLKLAPFMDSNTYAIALSQTSDNKTLPTKIDGVSIRYIKPHKLFDKIIFHTIKFIFGQLHADNFSYLIKTYIQSIPFRIRHKQHAVLSTYQLPYPMMTTSIMGRKTKKALFIMDPRDAMYEPNMTVEDEKKWFLSAIKQHDVIFTTKSIRKAMMARGYDAYAKNIVEVSFPMITGFPYKTTSNNEDKITLLFAGRIYEGIRSPEFFLKVISKLDERFRLVFIGQDCDNVKKYILPETKVEIITRTAIPYGEIMQEMANADVLINIGNSVPVHLPSKTLEYINTGKPIVNFYKFDECPTLYCTERYPLCLNISEQEQDIDAVSKKFFDFCINSKGKQVDRDYIENTFRESTPKAIAETICNELFN